MALDGRSPTLTRSQVDLETGTLRLAPGSTKNGDGRLVYLTPELRVSLAEQLARVRTLERELEGIPHVFPALRGPSEASSGKACPSHGDMRAQELACQASGSTPTAYSRAGHGNAGVSERVAMTISGHRTRDYSTGTTLSRLVTRETPRERCQTTLVQKRAQIYHRRAVNPWNSSAPLARLWWAHSNWILSAVFDVPPFRDGHDVIATISPSAWWCRGGSNRRTLWAERLHRLQLHVHPWG